MRRLLILGAIVLIGSTLAVAHAPELHQFRLVAFNRPFPAPPFSVPDLNGSETALADFLGKVVLLNFWATWCVPCVKEMPAMERLYQEFKNRPFTVVAVSTDEEGAEKVSAFARKLGLTFSILLDADSQVSKRYGVKELPSSFLIDPQGRVIAAAKGERDWFSSGAREYVAEVVAAAGKGDASPQAVSE